MFGWVQKTIESTVMDIATAPTVSTTTTTTTTTDVQSSSSTSSQQPQQAKEIVKSIEVIVKPFGGTSSVPSSSTNESNPNNPIIQILKQKLADETSEKLKAFERLKQRETQLETIQLELASTKKENSKLSKQLEETKKDVEEKLSVLETNWKSKLEKEEKKSEQLFTEGEVLSKKILQLEVANKKHRARIKEVEDKSLEQNTMLESKEKEIQKLCKEISEWKVVHSEKEILVQQSLQQTKQVEETNQLIQNLQRKVNDLEMKNNELQIEKSKVVTELEDWKKVYSQEQMEILKQKSSAYELQIQNLKEQSSKLQETLKMQTNDFDLKYNLLKKELETQIQKCAMAESKNEDMAFMIPNATRPLLEQIQSLQKNLDEKSSTWKIEEKKLLSRIQYYDSKCKTLEKEFSKNQQLVEQLNYDNSQWKLKMESMTLSVSKYEEQLKNLKNLVQQLEENFATSQTQNEKLKVELEETYTKCKELKQRLKLRKLEELEISSKRSISRDEKSSPLSDGPSISPSPPLSPYAKNASPFSSFVNTPVLPTNKQPVHTENTEVIISVSSDDMFVQSPTINVKQQNDKFASLNQRLEQLEKMNEKLLEDMSTLKTQNNTLQEARVNYETLKPQFDELNSRYIQSLETIRRKDETIQILQEDFQEVKETFRKQINDLLANK